MRSIFQDLRDPQRLAGRAGARQSGSVPIVLKRETTRRRTKRLYSVYWQRVHPRGNAASNCVPADFENALATNRSEATTSSAVTAAKL